MCQVSCFGIREIVKILFGKLGLCISLIKQYRIWIVNDFGQGEVQCFIGKILFIFKLSIICNSGKLGMGNIWKYENLEQVIEEFFYFYRVYIFGWGLLADV